MRKFLRVGKIISLHGIKGEVKVFPTTDDIKRFDDLKKVYIINDDDFKNDVIDDNLLYEIENVKYFKNTAILKIKNLNTIEESLKLIKSSLYVGRDNAVKLSENEYFVIDLIGLAVVYQNKSFGKVADIMKTKANDVLVIDYNGKEVLVPLVDVYIDKVDFENKNIMLKNLEGLI